ncbi:unnamed protein product [Somion occarium]|uniref:Uncharacterized protein n=1 Tax=Somion occarium TaxID=3059160 RepID=A0ABP1DCW1_9APHY
MGAYKRKADIVISDDEDDYRGWVPTVPAPSTYSAYGSYTGYYPGAQASTSSFRAGSYTNPIVIPDSPPPVPAAKAPPAKRRRKQKDPDTRIPEKRLAIFKKKCPMAIRERAERVATQRMYMIDRARNGAELKETFSVLGSTGNVYTVVIDKLPSCNCPDALKGNHCKHILFIFLKVLQVTQDSGYWYQKALLTSELDDIFSNAPLAPASAVNTRVQEAYASATGKRASSSSQGVKKRMPEKDTDCPVCYESMYGTAESTLVFCESCGNALHKDCFQQWAKATRGNVNCVFCRAPWAPATSASGSRSASGGIRTSEGYVNLAGVAGLSPVRDTSTYYHGPRRGQTHYGYEDYDSYY